MSPPSLPNVWRLTMMAIVLVAATACGGESPTAGNAAVSSSSSVMPAELTPTTDAPVTTSVPPATATAPATAVQATALAVFAGRFVGSTGGSGNAEIRDDGSGRFEVADLIACPSCSTASAPRATIDFKLTATAPTGSGGYRGTGAITAQSNPAQAAAIGAGAVGASIEATLTAAGGLTLSFLRPENVLLRTGGAASATTSAPATRTDTGPDAFLSPTRNIGCRISASSIRCDIGEKEWQPPPKPASCNEDWGFALGVTGQGSGQFRCAGDTAIGGVTTSPVSARSLASYQTPTREALTGYGQR